MSDYIERQKVKDIRFSGGINHDGFLYVPYKELVDGIKALPAADAVPVRLGVWLDGYKMQTCSLCKCKGKKSWTFCPHCGARMIYGKREE